MSKAKAICLFDVDGTLTQSRNVIKPEMMEYLQHLRKRVPLAVVSGSDLVKILEQMGGNDSINKFEYMFTENGLVAHKNGESIGQMDIVQHLGDDKLQAVINHALGYMSKLVLPRKRGTFIEFRHGMLNFCPVGRSCSQKERDEFSALDKEQGIRVKFKENLEETFKGAGLVFAIGGQISIDCFPEGWDKRYCLRYVENEFEEIHFFGDRTGPGGNDHEIFEDPRTIGHTVTDPDDTVRQLKELFPES